MSNADLIEQLRAQVLSLKSPRGASRGRPNEPPGAGVRDGAATGAGWQGKPLPRMGSGNEADAAIVVNVGGVNYTTTVATLKAVESSYFSLMLNGLWEPARTREGNIFVDRNGELFGWILEHLRGQYHKEADTFQLPSDLDRLKALLREAEFYQLPVLVSRLSKKLQGMQDAQEKTQPEAEGEEAPDVESSVEFDMAYSAVSSTHAQFPEEVLHDLTMRVNYQVFLKCQDGFTVRDVNSGVLLDQSDQAMPYSMYMQVVLVRNRKALNPAACAVAPAIRAGRYCPPNPFVMPYQRGKMPLRRHASPIPSSVQSPVPEVGHYRAEALGLASQSTGGLAGERFGYAQASRTCSPAFTADPLHQVTEARLSLQALVAEYSSKIQPPAWKRSRQGQNSVPELTLDGLRNGYDQPINQARYLDPSGVQYAGADNPAVACVPGPKNGGALPRNLPPPSCGQPMAGSLEGCAPRLDRSINSQGPSLRGSILNIPATELDPAIADCNTEVQKVMQMHNDGDAHPGNIPDLVDPVLDIPCQLSGGFAVEDSEGVQDPHYAVGGYCDDGTVDVCECLEDAANMAQEGDKRTSTQALSPSCDKAASENGDVAVYGMPTDSGVVGDDDELDEDSGLRMRDGSQKSMSSKPATCEPDKLTSCTSCHDSAVVSDNEAHDVDGHPDDSGPGADALPADMMGSPVCLLPTENQQAQEAYVSTESTPVADVSEVNDDIKGGHSGPHNMNEAEGLGTVSRGDDTHGEPGIAAIGVTASQVMAVEGSDAAVETEPGTQPGSPRQSGPDPSNECEEESTYPTDNSGAVVSDSSFQGASDQMQGPEKQATMAAMANRLISEPLTHEFEAALMSTGSGSEQTVNEPPTPDQDAPTTPAISPPASCDAQDRSGCLYDLCDFPVGHQNAHTLEGDDAAAPDGVNIPAMSGPLLNDPLLFGPADEVKRPAPPPVHVAANMVSMGSTPGSQGTLLAPPKRTRRHWGRPEVPPVIQKALSPRSRNKTASLSPRSGAKAVSRADQPPKSQMTSQTAKATEEPKPRSRIPRLNLAPVMAAASRGLNRTFGASRPAAELQDQPTGTGGPAKYPGVRSKQQGKVNRAPRRDAEQSSQYGIYRPNV